MANSRPHYHFWDLPPKIFPRTRGNLSSEYSRDLGRLFKSLAYTNKKLQESAVIATFHINSAMKKGGYDTTPQQTLGAVEEFVYHYENFCQRIFMVREKVLLLINEVLPVGYESTYDVSLKQLLINPTVKQIGLDTWIKKFSGISSALGQVISDRNSLTHKLYYGHLVGHLLMPQIPPQNINSTWFKSWSNEVVKRSRLVEKALGELSTVNHAISSKIVVYRNQQTALRNNK